MDHSAPQDLHWAGTFQSFLTWKRCTVQHGVLVFLRICMSWDLGGADSDNGKFQVGIGSTLSELQDQEDSILCKN